jgi:hypothetical protein
MLEGSPKLIASDEQPNHHVVHMLCLRKADRPADQPLDPGPRSGSGRQGRLFQHDLLTCAGARTLPGAWPVPQEPAGQSQVRQLLEVVLPWQTYRIAEVLALLAWRQRRNHSAYLSHRKRRETEG